MKTFSRRLMCCLIAMLVFFVCRAATPPGSDRLRIFISDTHFGPGKVDGHWHNFEDARWAPEFAESLEEMNRMGKGKADLILNGDTFGSRMHAGRSPETAPARNSIPPVRIRRNRQIREVR